jgi:acyl dehydratase
MKAAAPLNWPHVGEQIGVRTFGPFVHENLAEFAKASGDDNPLHLNTEIAQAVGLAEPPVHGMLLMSCLEPALRQWRPNLAIKRLTGKFLRPVLAGESISITGRVVRSTQDTRPEIVLRLMAHGAANALSILAEATLVQVRTSP